MDTSYLQEVADYQVAKWWRVLRKHFPSISETAPQAKLNNRLKATAGRAWIQKTPPFIDLSTELFWCNTEQFCEDTIPHELAHIVAHQVFKDPGHGKGWYHVIKVAGIKTTRLHHMMNHIDAQRKANK